MRGETLPELIVSSCAPSWRNIPAQYEFIKRTLRIMDNHRCSAKIYEAYLLYADFKLSSCRSLNHFNFPGFWIYPHAVVHEIVASSLRLTQLLNDLAITLKIRKISDQLLAQCGKNIEALRKTGVGYQDESLRII